MDKKTTTRVQLEFSAKDFELLKLLKQRMGATSYVEVLRTSLRIIRSILNYTDSGEKLIARDKDGHEKEIIFVGLS